MTLKVDSIKTMCINNEMRLFHHNFHFFTIYQAVMMLLLKYMSQNNNPILSIRS
jgi:hypothetical protein